MLCIVSFQFIEKTLIYCIMYQLTEKVSSLEKALSQMVREFEEERETILQNSSRQAEHSK